MLVTLTPYSAYLIVFAKQQTALGFVMMITMLFTVGSLEDAIAASSPFQNSFTNTGSTGVNVALTLILALLIGAANITSLATTSREVWAFARDGGTPAHRWISRVSPNSTIPPYQP